ncbi:MAG: LrgB family protein [Rhodospirillaceae bacterium]
MSDPKIQALWVYLASAPLFWLALTLVVYQGFNRLFVRSGRIPLLNPVLWSIVVLAGLLTVSGTSYESYFEGAQFIHFLLGPATVALAVPLYRQFDQVRRSVVALGIALPVGSVIAAGAAVLLAGWLGADRATLVSLSPKSVTTPIAMGISEKLGGVPSLTAVFVILTGVIGAILASVIFRTFGIRDQRAMGFSLGLAAHGLGTARAFQFGETAGAFAGMAIGLNGLATAVLLPILVPILLAMLD